MSVSEDSAGPADIDSPIKYRVLLSYICLLREFIGFFCGYRGFFCACVGLLHDGIMCVFVSEGSVGPVVIG